jgi:hypothetical protein
MDQKIVFAEQGDELDQFRFVGARLTPLRAEKPVSSVVSGTELSGGYPPGSASDVFS